MNDMTNADGNGVELYWDRPEQEWPRDREGKLAMFTRPLDVRSLLAEANGAKLLKTAQYDREAVGPDKP